MKNLNRTKLNIPWNNYQAYVEYKIMERDAKKVLESLGNPETSEEALVFLQEILENNPKYASIIPNDKRVLYKILSHALDSNRPIEDILWIFSQQYASHIALAKVNTGMVVASSANYAYKPINNINFNDNQKVA